jgi:hypothetical protein
VTVTSRFARWSSQPAAAAAGACAAASACLAVLVLIAAVGGAASPAIGVGAELAAADPPSALARSDIPSTYLGLYIGAARAFALDWAVIAGIGKVECDHGRGADRSCSQLGATNPAGAGGPMQFLASTWVRFGRDANGDGNASRWDPADAIYSAAAYLAASGAPGDYARALFAYNHASWYVTEVERWAARYREHHAEPVAGALTPPGGTTGGVAQRTPTPVVFVAGDRARLQSVDRHVALIPVEVPPAVQAMVVAGNELQALPYGAAGHPDPRGAPAEDCSSSVSYVLYRAGIRPIAEIIRENPLAQDYTRWGEPGAGRWVTIYATARPVAHTFIVIAGLRLDTSHNGTDVGPNSAEGGPRWRVFDGIPTWARWSVRHPPGL